MLQYLPLIRDRITGPTAYPFSFPAIQSLTTLRFVKSRITFLTGENCSGKSTVLETIPTNSALATLAAIATSKAASNT